jgi:hypothetical protein
MPAIPGSAGGGASASDVVTFVDAVAKQTGLDPRVVETQVIAEGAYAPGGTGGLNFLNLRPYSSDVGVVGYSKGGFDQFGDLQSAITSTVARIKQPFLQKYLGPVLAKPSTPEDQLRAIAVSGWDAGHYVGTYDGASMVGGSLFSDFASKFGAGALTGKAQSQPLTEAGGAGAKSGFSLHDVGLPSASDIFSGLESWAGNFALYGAFVLLAVALFLLGLLRVLGVRFGTVMQTLPGRRAAVAA